MFKLTVTNKEATPLEGIYSGEDSSLTAELPEEGYDEANFRDICEKDD